MSSISDDVLFWNGAEQQNTTDLLDGLVAVMNTTTDDVQVVQATANNQAKIAGLVVGDAKPLGGAAGSGQKRRVRVKKNGTTWGKVTALSSTIAVNSVITIGTEKMLVTAVSTLNLTCTRGYDSTPVNAGTIASGTNVYCGNIVTTLTGTVATASAGSSSTVPVASLGGAALPAQGDILITDSNGGVKAWAAEQGTINVVGRATQTCTTLNTKIPVDLQMRGTAIVSRY